MRRTGGVTSEHGPYKLRGARGAVLCRAVAAAAAAQGRAAHERGAMAHLRVHVRVLRRHDPLAGAPCHLSSHLRQCAAVDRRATARARRAGIAATRAFRLCVRAPTEASATRRTLAKFILQTKPSSRSCGAHTHRV